jgi:hypothetical protein
MKVSIITPALVKDARGAQWLHECIASVEAQGGDLEHIIVDDHSPYKLDGLQAAWPGVRWLKAEGQGVSEARNQAADAARGELLLPVDADDKLAPEAVASFLRAWDGRGDNNIIYSDVVMFGEDYAQVYLAPEYAFKTLLGATFMTVGCLHKKADWARAGGWRVDMTRGLEDWEYWIALGELGVCGKRLPEPLYWYRRHPRGRLQWLKANQELWNQSYAAMRELHRDSYNGRYPMGCCGGRAKSAVRPAKATTRLPAAMVANTAAVAQKEDGAVLLAYYGPRKGDFRVAGGVTRTMYHVPGRGEVVRNAQTGRQGVNPADVAWFRSVNSGQDFRLVAQPQAPGPAPQPAPPPAPTPAETPRTVDPAAWEPSVMEDLRTDDTVLGVPDLQSLTVAEIHETDIGAHFVPALIAQEKAGKNRKTVLEHLEGLGG